MAYAAPRSCKEALHDGMSDGAVRKPTVDRGGIVSSEPDAYPGHVLSGLCGPKGSL